MRSEMNSIIKPGKARNNEPLGMRFFLHKFWKRDNSSVSKTSFLRKSIQYLNLAKRETKKRSEREFFYVSSENVTTIARRRNHFLFFLAKLYVAWLVLELSLTNKCFKNTSTDSFRVIWCRHSVAPRALTCLFKRNYSVRLVTVQMTPSYVHTSKGDFLFCTFGLHWHGHANSDSRLGLCQ